MTIEFLNRSEAERAGHRVPDVYYSPAYGATAELVDGGVWECAVGDGGRFVLPYLKRLITANLGGDTALGEYDIVSPYGYAGVARSDHDQMALSCFRKEFLEHSRERGLIAEFLRTNPFDVDAETVESMGFTAYKAHSTFAVRGTGEPSAYWERCEGRHRTAVRKADRSGVELSFPVVDELRDASSGFRRVYDITMDRVGASGRLRLDNEYFNRLVDGLSTRLTVIEARLDGAVCAAAIFIAWDDRLHYHLSGSTPAGLKAGAGNALLDAAVRQLLPAHGVLHLGGGLHSGDGLEQFKRSVSTEECMVYFGQTVVNDDRYRQLAGAMDDKDYFPAYRAPR